MKLYFNKKECIEIHSYLKKLYQNTLPTSWIEIRNHNRFFMYQVKDMLEKEKCIEILSGFQKQDCMITFQTFKSCKLHNQLENVLSLSSFCLDIDYHQKKAYEELSPKQIYGLIELDYIKSGLLPAPTYVEYGHNLRLIYQLEEPLHLSKKSQKPMLSLLNKLTEHFTTQLIEFTNDKQSLSSYIRLPFSINSKDKSVITVETVHSPITDIQFLLDEYLAHTYEEVLEYQKTKKKKASKKGFTGLLRPKRTISLQTFNEHRLDDLRTAQSLLTASGVPSGYRETLCYLFKNYALLSGKTETTAIEMLLTFNQQFLNPLPEKQVLSATRNLTYNHLYTHTSATFFSLLQKCGLVIDDIFIFKTLMSSPYSIGEKQEYNKNYYQDKLKKSKRNKKQTELKFEQQQILLMAKAGYTNKYIADFLKCSISKIAKILHQLRFYRNQYTYFEKLLYRKQFLGALKSKQHRLLLNRKIKILKHPEPQKVPVGYREKETNKFVITSYKMGWQYINDTEYSLLEDCDFDLLKQYCFLFWDELKAFAF